MIEKTHFVFVNLAYPVEQILNGVFICFSGRQLWVFYSATLVYVLRKLVKGFKVVHLPKNIYNPVKTEDCSFSVVGHTPVTSELLIVKINLDAWKFLFKQAPYILLLLPCRILPDGYCAFIGFTVYTSNVTTAIY